MSGFKNEVNIRKRGIERAKYPVILWQSLLSSNLRRSIGAYNRD